jgi:sensor histidine kinase regulating citrate/malate metabolism
MDVRADDHEADSNMTGASSLAGPEEPTYSLFVDMNGRRIRISEVNAIADESRTMVRGRRHGGGIALHRAAIESLGGTLNASQQDGTWTLSAEIPY